MGGLHLGLLSVVPPGLPKLGDGLSNAFKSHFAAEHNHGFKKRRCIFPSADGYPIRHRHLRGCLAGRYGLSY